MKSLELSVKILNELKTGKIISGNKLSEQCNISRSAVWKKINILRKEGYVIKAMRHKGYILENNKECFSPEEISSRLKTKVFGENIFFYNEVTSTNELAYQYALKNSKEGALFISESQTNGRGRMGRKWFSPKGKGLWFSLVLRPKVDFSDITILPLLTAVSCVDAIRKISGLDIKIKWPNDLLINGKKIGGILLEMKAEIDRINFIILGIGIDVNIEIEEYPAELRNIVTSLKIVKGNSVSRVELLADILEILENRYINYPENKFDIIELYSQLCSNLGKIVKVESQNGIIEGKAVKIDENGCLVLKNNHGDLLKISSGDIIPSV